MYHFKSKPFPPFYLMKQSKFVKKKIHKKKKEKNKLSPMIKKCNLKINKKSSKNKKQKQNETQFSTTYKNTTYSLEHQNCYIWLLLQPQYLGCLLSRALNYGHIEILPVIAVKAAIGALYDTFGGPDCTVLRI